MVAQAKPGCILVNHQEKTSTAKKKKGAVIKNIFNAGFIRMVKLKMMPLKKKMNEMAKIWIWEMRVSILTEAPRSFGWATAFRFS